jgi:hypothetical protein
MGYSCCVPMNRFMGEKSRGEPAYPQAVDFGAVIDALHPAQQELAREINPKVFSSREWKTNLKKKIRSRPI